MSAINVLAELQRLGIEYNLISTDEVRLVCPFHEDQTPSCDVSTAKAMFKCRACGTDGDIVKLLAKLSNKDRKSVFDDLASRYNLSNEPSIDASIIERYHSKIFEPENQSLLVELYKRGVNDTTIRKYRLGIHRNRITIPILNAAGAYVNIRAYLPGANSGDKMKNLKGRAKKLRLYPHDQLTYKKILVTGGEVKALAGLQRLNEHGIGVVCATGGEGLWKPYLTDELSGKEVWLGFDIDQAGRRGTNAVGLSLYRYTLALYNIEWELDITKYPTGDLNDFVATGGDLLVAIQQAKRWEPRQSKQRHDRSVTNVTLQQASKATYTGERLRLSATIASANRSPFTVPRTLQVRCSREEACCSTCPVISEPEDKAYEIDPEDVVILKIVDSPDSMKRPSLMSALDVPPQCRSFDYEVTQHWNVQDTYVTQPLETTNTNDTERMLQRTFIVRPETVVLNECYVMMGTQHPHPKSQTSTLLISEALESKDSLTTFKPQHHEPLLVFQPRNPQTGICEWTVEGLDKKLKAIYKDLEHNVTHIWERQDLHLMIDLAYHSPLHFTFGGKKDQKGWVEVLVVGDSAQGKSETIKMLLQHYQLGKKVECKNATAAGLLGGVTHNDKHWYVSWGVIPQHDRRLVVLEELKGTSTSVISKLTDARSSGIAELPKIESHHQTFARTRLIALSNPRSSRTVDEYDFGLMAFSELIGNPEDLRRFDACLILDKGEIDPKQLNLPAWRRPEIKHEYTSTLCHLLILLAWTIKSDQIEFETEATQAILDQTDMLCKEFVDDPPLIDRGSTRLKLARLSAALAMRTYSIDGVTDDFKLVIRKCHVDYIVQFLRSIYSKHSCGYLAWSKNKLTKRDIRDAERINNFISSQPNAVELVECLLAKDPIDLTDLVDFTGMDNQTARDTIGMLVRANCLIREGREYSKSSGFIALLRNLATSITSDMPDWSEF